MTALQEFDRVIKNAKGQVQLARMLGISQGLVTHNRRQAKELGHISKVMALLLGHLRLGNAELLDPRLKDIPVAKKKQLSNRVR